MPDHPASAPIDLRRRARALLGRRLVKAALVNSLGNAVMVGSYLLAAVILARTVGPAGRGDLAAITAAPPIVGWLAEIGCQQSVSYHRASRERTSSQLLSTWIVICIPLALGAIVAGEIVIHFTLAAQSSHVRAIATIYMLVAAAVVGMSPIFGLLLGAERYAAFALLRAIQAMSLLGAYAFLRLSGHLTVDAAAAATAAGWIIIFLTGCIMLRDSRPLERFDPKVAKQGLWYGIKAHGNTTASLVALRLDLVLLPAFVSDHKLGLYAIAASVSDLARLFLGAIVVVVLPATARDPQRRDTVVMGTAAVLAASGLAAALAIGLVAPWMLGVVYGHAFRPGALCLRLLLPGSIALLVSTSFVNGLLALNRPFLASVTQLPSAVFTVVALLIVLPRGAGIVGAAVVSSISYVTTLLAAWWLYRSSTARTKARSSSDPLAG